MDKYENLYPVAPLFRPANRRQKRLILNDYDRYSLKLGVVEDQFAKEVFKESQDKRYQDLYLEFIKKYASKVDYVRALKPKHVVINDRYFYDLYKPEEEMIKPSIVVSFIHELARKLFK